MFNSMLAKAAELGANAVILDALTEPSAGAKIAGAFLGYSAQRTGKAVAIYVFATAAAANAAGIAKRPSAAIDTRLRTLNEDFRALRITREEYLTLKAALEGEE